MHPMLAARRSSSAAAAAEAALLLLAAVPLLFFKGAEEIPSAFETDTGDYCTGKLQGRAKIGAGFRIYG